MAVLVNRFSQILSIHFQMTISQAGMEFWKITSLELIVLSALGKVHQQLRKLRMEAKTVKTKKKMEWGQKLLKSAKSCHYFEPLQVRLGMDFWGTSSA